MAKSEFEWEIDLINEAAKKAAEAMEMLRAAFRDYEALRARLWAVRISRWLFGDGRK